MARPALLGLVVLVLVLLACAEQQQQPPQTPGQRAGQAIGAFGDGIERGMRSDPEPQQAATYCRFSSDCPPGFDCVRRSGAGTGICLD
jgi:hypothetical protein